MPLRLLYITREQEERTVPIGFREESQTNALRIRTHSRIQQCARESFRCEREQWEQTRELKTQLPLLRRNHLLLVMDIRIGRLLLLNSWVGRFLIRLLFDVLHLDLGNILTLLHYS